MKSPMHDLPMDLRVEAIRILRVIRHIGPFCNAMLDREFLSDHVDQVRETGLFETTIEDGNVISEQGLRLLVMFDPKPRA